MTQLTPERIEQELRSQPAATPPPELLEAIQSEIPELAGTGSNLGNDGPPSSYRRWLIAATVLVAVGGGLIGRQALREVDRASVTKPPGDATIETGNETTETPAQLLEVDSDRTQEPVESLQNSPESAMVGGDSPPKAFKKEVSKPAPARDAESGLRTHSETQRHIDPQPMDFDDSNSFVLEDQIFEAPEPRVQPATPPALPSPSSRKRAGEPFPAGQEEIRAESSLAEGNRQFETKGASGMLLSRRPEPVPPSPTPSTGGTAEPNDRPYGDVFYSDYGVNPFIDTEDDALSTFGLDVDTGSYSIARRYLDDGNLPPREAIRAEEFLNYFDYQDAPPKRGDFALTADLAPAPFGSGERYHLLRFGIRGRDVEAEDRLPATLIFVIDVSGSMARENRLELVKRSLTLLVDQLKPEDRIGLVVYGSSGEVLLEPTNDHRAILGGIDRLRSGGSTNAEEGLSLAYDLAHRHFRGRAINRILLCSDGVANVGATGPESILDRIRSQAHRGIELSTFGFGMGNYNDVLMEQLANSGDGQYAYIDDLSEAQRVFVENLTGTLQTLAGDAKAQVEFNPEVVSRYRLIGYENRDIADNRFRDDTVDAGEIGAGHRVTALYEVKLREESSRRAPLATLHLRYRAKSSGRIEEIELGVAQRDGASEWRDAAPALRLAAAVAEFAELLKGSYWSKEGSFEALLPVAQDAAAGFARDRDVAEFLGLVGKAAKISN